ncbi:hypothetical protein [Cyanobium sp. NIES-981]|uniref:hypothetical protein n=1 Tax=Cyanobium sp. NIES-981 TaxID=1851505 RepID=UPI0007DD7C4F|nr:hypothetical protein [Cyanobium sp. NIES-981]SBO44347.1 conserved protein of unknown function [Cyanobium sp. NIES-981]
MSRQPPQPDHDLATRRRPGRLALGRTVGAGALALALVVGIQLGRVPWRYRRQILQLQGFLLGAVVGYVVGRLDRGQQPPP